MSDTEYLYAFTQNEKPDGKVTFFRTRLPTETVQNLFKGPLKEQGWLVLSTPSARWSATWAPRSLASILDGSTEILEWPLSLSDKRILYWEFYELNASVAGRLRGSPNQAKKYVGYGHAFEVALAGLSPRNRVVTHGDVQQEVPTAVGQAIGVLTPDKTGAVGIYRRDNDELVVINHETGSALHTKRLALFAESFDSEPGISCVAQTKDGLFFHTIPEGLEKTTHERLLKSWALWYSAWDPADDWSRR